MKNLSIFEPQIEKHYAYKKRHVLLKLEYFAKTWNQYFTYCSLNFSQNILILEIMFFQRTPRQKTLPLWSARPTPLLRHYHKGNPPARINRALWLMASLMMRRRLVAMTTTLSRARKAFKTNNRANNNSGQLIIAIWWYEAPNQDGIYWSRVRM